MTIPGLIIWIIVLQLSYVGLIKLLPYDIDDTLFGFIYGAGMTYIFILANRL